MARQTKMAGLYGRFTLRMLTLTKELLASVISINVKQITLPMLLFEECRISWPMVIMLMDVALTMMNQDAKNNELIDMLTT